MDDDIRARYGTPQTYTEPEPVRTESGGCLGALGFYAAGFVLPAASLSFYRRAVERRPISAVLFFVIFMGTITVLTTVGMVRQLANVSLEIQRVFADGTMPAITIAGGEAFTAAPQPAIIMDQEGVLVAVDTTGQLPVIPRDRYVSGFLVTRTELHILNRGEYQRLPLIQLNQSLEQDPLRIDGQTVSQWWNSFSAIFSVIALVGLSLWNIGVRLAYLALLALLVTAVTRAFSKIPYSAVFTVGVYAFVPAIILHTILGLFNVRFLFLQTLILLVAWSVGLYAVLTPRWWDLLGPDRPLRAWRALLGLPMLGTLALNLIFSWPKGNIIVLIGTAVSGLLLVAAAMFTLPEREDEEPAPAA